MGAGVAAGLGKMLAGATGGMVTGKKELLNREAESAATAEDTRRWEEEQSLKKQTLAHTQFMDKMKYEHGVDQDNAELYLAAIGKSMDMIREGADPKAAEQFYNMFAKKAGFDAITNLQVDKKTGNWSFHTAGGDIMGYNSATGDMDVIGHYTPDSVQAAKVRESGEEAPKPADIRGHMNQILKEYGGGEKSISFEGGVFKQTDSGTAAYKDMVEAARTDPRAAANVILYDELKSELEQMSLGRKTPMEGLLGPGGAFGNEDFEKIMSEHSGEGKSTEQAMATALIDYWIKKGLSKPEATKKAQEQMSGLGIGAAKEK